MFERQEEFFDANVASESRNQTYERLAMIGEVVGVEKDEILKLLLVADKPDKEGQLNVGNKVTSDIKLMVKVCA